MLFAILLTLYMMCQTIWMLFAIWFTLYFLNVIFIFVNPMYLQFLTQYIGMLIAILLAHITVYNTT